MFKQLDKVIFPHRLKQFFPQNQQLNPEAAKHQDHPHTCSIVIWLHKATLSLRMWKKTPIFEK